mmetsp:Transcript_43559/g.94925  ORF Transcript_43559/g.94925 Transcript_43559/m.94925 type:complete len:231 (+) Transcript_43559:441-1133(+)
MSPRRILSPQDLQGSSCSWHSPAWCSSNCLANMDFPQASQSTGLARHWEECCSTSSRGNMSPQWTHGTGALRQVCLCFATVHNSIVSTQYSQGTSLRGHSSSWSGSKRSNTTSEHCGQSTGRQGQTQSLSWSANSLRNISRPHCGQATLATGHSSMWAITTERGPEKVHPAALKLHSLLACGHCLRWASTAEYAPLQLHPYRHLNWTRLSFLAKSRASASSHSNKPSELK